jgi:HSP20 family protein
MKLDLDRWNLFKFGRRTPTRPPQMAGAAEGGGVQRQQGSEGGGLPAAWLDAQGLPEPMRMMGDFLRDPFGSLTQVDRWFGDFSPGAFQPRIDVVDDGDALRITAELPGMERHDVEVVLEDEYLILRGEKKLESRGEDHEKGSYHVERAFGSFQRIVPLPDGVDVEHAEARFDNGTLTIRLPKAAARKSSERKLEIQPGTHQAAT